MARLLLKKGALVYLPDSKGRSALTIAKHLQMAKVLLEAGTQIDLPSVFPSSLSLHISKSVSSLSLGSSVVHLHLLKSASAPNLLHLPRNSTMVTTEISATTVNETISTEETGSHTGKSF